MGKEKKPFYKKVVGVGNRGCSRSGNCIGRR